MNDQSAGILLIIISAVGFGTLGIFGIIAAEEGLSIPTVLLLRFGLATVFIWAFLWMRGRFRLLRGRLLVIALGLGGLGYAAMSGLYFLGLEFMTAGMVAILLYTYPAFVVCIVAIFHQTRITRLVIIALVAAIAGVSLITGADPAGMDPIGVVIMLGAALSYALYIVVSQRALLHVDPAILTAYVLPAAAVTFLLFGVGTDTLAMPASPEAWSVALAIAVVATVIPVLAFLAGVSRIGASRASIISAAEPGVTVVLGVIILSEPLTAVTVIGGALILTGVLLIQRESI